MEKTRVLLLSCDALTTRVMYHYLHAKHDVVAVLLEKKVSVLSVLKGRIKKQGLWKVAGQILFRVLVANWLKMISGKRVEAILEQHELQTELIDESKIIRVKSVNDKHTADLIRKISPDVIVVHGTRIINPKILELLPGKFVNLHAGITPLYRGVHGMYWALASGDTENAGVTIHLVDSGIDTGKILFQKKISASPKDNFYTYPFLQLAEGLPLLSQSIDELNLGNFQAPMRNEKGKLRYHPTLWHYLRFRLLKGAK